MSATAEQQAWLASLRERHGEITGLARAVALAVRVEPALLRRARLELLPELDVGAESDLWWSELVGTRSGAAVVLDADVLAALRAELEDADPAWLEHARRLVEEVHADASPALQLEERLVWIAVRREDGWEDALEQELRTAVRALSREGETRAKGVARWADRALTALPRAVLETESAGLLFLGASARLGSRSRARARWPRGGVPLRASWVLPEADTDGTPGEARIGVRAHPGALRFVSADTPYVSTLPLPEREAPVEVTWDAVSDTDPGRASVVARPGAVLELPEGVERVQFETGDGIARRLELFERFHIDVASREATFRDVHPEVAGRLEEVFEALEADPFAIGSFQAEHPDGRLEYEYRDPEDGFNLRWKLMLDVRPPGLEITAHSVLPADRPQPATDGGALRGALTLDVYIAYDGRDATHADQLHGALADRGIDAWMDPREFERGEEWVGQMQDTLGRARVLVVLWNRDALDSNWLQHELTLGARRAEVGELTIVPVLVSDSGEERFRFQKIELPWANVEALEILNAHDTQQTIDEVADAVAARLRGKGSRQQRDTDADADTGTDTDEAPSAKPGRVFISHAREDRQWVDALAEALERYGHSVWSPARNLSADDMVARAVMEAVKEADAVVAVVTSRSMESDFVNDELGYARVQGKPILTVVAEPPPSESWARHPEIDDDRRLNNQPLDRLAGEQLAEALDDVAAQIDAVLAGRPLPQTLAETRPEGGPEATPESAEDGGADGGGTAEAPGDAAPRLHEIPIEPIPLALAWADLVQAVALSFHVGFGRDDRRRLGEMLRRLSRMEPDAFRTFQGECEWLFTGSARGVFASGWPAARDAIDEELARAQPRGERPPEPSGLADIAAVVPFLEAWHRAVLDDGGWRELQELAFADTAELAPLEKEFEGHGFARGASGWRGQVADAHELVNDSGRVFQEFGEVDPLRLAVGPDIPFPLERVVAALEVTAQAFDQLPTRSRGWRTPKSALRDAVVQPWRLSLAKLRDARVPVFEKRWSDLDLVEFLTEAAGLLQRILEDGGEVLADDAIEAWMDPLAAALALDRFPVVFERQTERDVTVSADFGTWLRLLSESTEELRRALRAAIDRLDQGQGQRAMA